MPQQSVPYLSGFWFEMRVIALCVFMDARDLIFHLPDGSYPYPGYIREGVRAGGVMEVKDPRAPANVTRKSRVLGPQ
jgi:hypothetical protein